MRLNRCENGHFYDEERFTSCPFCNQNSTDTVVGGGDIGETMPIDPAPTSPPTFTPPSTPPNDNLKDLVSEVKNETDFSTTVGYFGVDEPVVGWLVSIEGSNFGQDFKLRSGRNYIGRAPDMDVVLEGDSSVSRTRHAVIVYEPKSNIFLVQPGDSKELFYLNDQVVLSTMEIKAYDVILLGKTKLLFIPCCSDKFNWDSVKPEEDKEYKK